MRHAESFRDLVVYQKARAVARRLFELSKSFPKDDTYSLTDRGRRSSGSIGAQIAEADQFCGQPAPASVKRPRATS